MSSNTQPSMLKLAPEMERALPPGLAPSLALFFLKVQLTIEPGVGFQISSIAPPAAV